MISKNKGVTRLRLGVSDIPQYLQRMGARVQVIGNRTAGLQVDFPTGIHYRAAHAAMLMVAAEIELRSEKAGWVVGRPEVSNAGSGRQIGTIYIETATGGDTERATARGVMAAAFSSVLS